MRKLQQFYIMKFKSGRLSNTNYVIERLNLKIAREKQEIVSLADSQALRTIRKIRYERQRRLGIEPLEFSQDTIDKLLLSKKKLLKIEPQSTESKQQLLLQIRNLNEKINNILYIPEYILIKIEDKKHYKDIIQKGLYITQTDILTGQIMQIKYVRLLCGAGMARNNTVAFIREDYETELKQLLRNGVDSNLKVVPNKYNAYFALSSTATHTLSTPKCCLISDCVINMTKKVNWVEYTNTDNKLLNQERVVQADKELEFNLFDGGGLVDISKARMWAEELELDYVPSVFVIRNIFIKGCLFTVDFHKFAAEVAHQKEITDLYGNTQQIEDCDIILTESLFKLWKGYTSMEQYQSECIKNGNFWGVSRVSPKKDDDFFTTNYQFLQVLDLQSQDVRDICQPTIDWLTGVGGLNREFALLYLLGSLCNRESDPQEVYNMTSDNIAKALIINPKMMQEQHIRQTIIQSLNKKIKEAYIGKLIVKGCFNTMIPDPYALMEWAFAKGDTNCIHGLLQDKEHYSAYWNQRHTTEGVGMRSPLTWRSEVNPLCFVNNEQTNEWYQYLDSGTIYNIWGCDCMLHADSDYDGDIVATTNNETFLKCRFKDLDDELAITYEKNTVDKQTINEKTLYKSDLDSFDTKIGQVTNYSTSFYDLLFKYKDKVDEYSQTCFQEIIERLKLIRKQQGNAIDAAKGIKVDRFPSIWIKQQKIKPEDDQETIARKQFLNDICGDRKPYFFKYRYPACGLKYKNFIESKQAWCAGYFGIELEDLLNKTCLNKQEQIFVDNYYKFVPLINYHSPMNQICNYLEEQLKIIDYSKEQSTPVEVVELMQTKSIELSEEVIGRIGYFYECYIHKKKELKSQQNSIYKPLVSRNTEDDNVVNMNQYAKLLRQKAEEYFCSIDCDTSLEESIANHIVEYAYKLYPSKDKSFVWNVFGKYLVNNIKLNTLKTTKYATVPLKDPAGHIDYLGAKYSIRTFEIQKIDDKVGEL